MLLLNPKCKFKCLNLFFTKIISFLPDQGFNAGKVISEVYVSFLLQCTVPGR